MEQLQASGGTITLIHFMCEIMMPPVEQEGPPTPQLRIACMPNMTEFHLTMYHPNYMRTNDVRATTCPQCMKTKQFQDAQKVLETVLRGPIRAT